MRGVFKVRRAGAGDRKWTDRHGPSRRTLNALSQNERAFQAKLDLLGRMDIFLELNSVRKRANSLGCGCWIRPRSH